MTSEEILGLPKQPPPSCPDIDKVLRSARDVSRSIRAALHNSRGEPWEDCVSDVETEWMSLDVEFALESLRTHNQTLRDWGQAWKEEAKNAGALEGLESTNE